VCLVPWPKGTGFYWKSHKVEVEVEVEVKVKVEPTSDFRLPAF
jgi:hypothetical protein